MMQFVLTDKAKELGMAFLFGERQAFNSAADKLDRDTPILYHEGYFNETVTQDAQGVFEPTEGMTLYLTATIERAPTPEMHREVLTTLREMAYSLLYKLDKDYVLTGITVVSNINMGTDRLLDGVRLIVSAKPRLTVGQC